MSGAEVARVLVAGAIAVLVWILGANWEQRHAAWLRWNLVAKPAPPSGGKPVAAAIILAQVSARLRAGATVQTAWDETLGPLAPQAADGCDEDAVPLRLALIPQLQPVVGTVAAACRLTRDLGVALADILDAILLGVEDAEAAHQEAAVARAGPQLTARLLTALPAAGVMAALLLGAPLWDYATDFGIGTVVTALGLWLWAVGRAWSAGLIRRVRDTRAANPVVVVELVAAAIGVGTSIPRSLTAVGRAAQIPGMENAAALLQLGADLEEACGQLEGRYRDLVEAVAPAWFQGAAPLPLLALLAQRWRREQATAAREAAQRLAVKLVLPLGLCLLPAFICLGIVPIVVTTLL